MFTGAPTKTTTDDEKIADAVLRALRALEEPSGLPRLAEALSMIPANGSQSARLRTVMELLNGINEPLRVFWKVLPDFKYAGCNFVFAKDSGLAGVKQMVGLTDFDGRISWNRQANKYRRDDEKVTDSGTFAPKLFERQDRPDGTVWVHTAKAPLWVSGKIVGLLGLYETIDDATARTRFS